MSENAQKASVAYIKELGVDLKTELFVKDYDGAIVTLSNGDTIKTKNLIWAAGVTGNFIEGIHQDVMVKRQQN
jgi:NADH dehydrogenase